MTSVIIIKAYHFKANTVTYIHTANLKSMLYTGTVHGKVAVKYTCHVPATCYMSERLFNEKPLNVSGAKKLKHTLFLLPQKVIVLLLYHTQTQKIYNTPNVNKSYRMHSFLTKLLVCLSSEKKVLIEAVFLVKSLVALREKKKKYNLGIIYFPGNLNLIYCIRFLISTESLLPKTFNFSATLAVSELRHRGCLRFGSPCCGF